MKWYLVVRPWSDSGHYALRHSDDSQVPYFGISGDTWSLDEIGEAATTHGKLKDELSYVDAPNGTSPLVCTEFSTAKNYFDVAVKFTSYARLLEIGFGYREGCDGVELGSPEGGYSIIDSEVIQVGDSERLNEHGLFADMRQMDAYLTERRMFKNHELLEDIDDYSILGVRILEFK